MFSYLQHTRLLIWKFRVWRSKTHGSNLKIFEHKWNLIGLVAKCFLPFKQFSYQDTSARKKIFKYTEKKSDIVASVFSANYKENSHLELTNHENVPMTHNQSSWMVGKFAFPCSSFFSFYEVCWWVAKRFNDDIFVCCRLTIRASAVSLSHSRLWILFYK